MVIQVIFKINQRHFWLAYGQMAVRIWQVALSSAP